MSGQHGDLSSYAELVEVIGSVSLLLREARRSRRLSVRTAAAQIGISFATVSRIEAGEDHNVSNLIAVLRWLDGSTTAAGGAEGDQSNGVSNA